MVSLSSPMRYPSFCALLVSSVHGLETSDIAGLNTYSPSIGWDQGRYSYHRTPACYARQIVVDRDSRLTYALTTERLKSESEPETEGLEVRDLDTGKFLSRAGGLPIKGTIVAGHGFIVIWWASVLERGVYPLAPASYIEVYKVGYGPRYSHKMVRPELDLPRGKLELVKSIARNYWIYGATLHIDTGTRGSRTTLAIAGIPSKLSNDKYAPCSFYGTILGLSFDNVPPHWTANRMENRYVYFYNLDLSGNKEYSVLDLGMIIGFHKNITIDNVYVFVSSEANVRIHARYEPEFVIELSLHSKYLLNSSKLTVQLYRFQEIEVRAAAQSVNQRVCDGEFDGEKLDFRQLLEKEVERSRKKPGSPRVRSAWLTPEGFWGTTSTTY